MTLDIADYKAESWTVTQGIQDALRILQTQIDKQVVPAFFETIQATAPDHIDITRTPFVGIIPAVDLTLATSANKSLLIGYDYGWYLTVQYVSSDDRVTLEDTNPSETIETLLGGPSWATVTGIEPHRINNVVDWDNIKKSFEFGDRCTRWSAIKEVADYCNFVFVVKWRKVNGIWRPCAYFVHEDDIDSSTAGLDIPAAITITEPDSHLMDGVYVKDSPEHRYNRVLATGYDAGTDTYYYATAQTQKVAAGTDIAIEYVYADASLNTQAKTDAKAQELLDFFQASSKVYVARFKRRMDLELYQKISFVGYDKIDTAVMRITRITYFRTAANDTVEIEFMKDQAVQQLKRLDRAVNPDYVSGQQDLIGSDLADVGLIDVFDDPVASGTAANDLWKVEGVSVELIDSKPVCLLGESLTRVGAVAGSLGENLPMWGSNSAGSSLTEFLRWNKGDVESTPSQYLEILEDICLNNKLYFDIDPSRPTYLQNDNTPSINEFSMYVGGSEMMRFMNYAGATEDKIGCYATIIATKDLLMTGTIKGDGYNLVFYDQATGTKTLHDLAEMAESANADTVDGWNIHQLVVDDPEYVKAGWYQWWYWSFPYAGTDMSVIPAIRTHTGDEIGYYPNLTVHVMKQDFGSNGIYIMVHNGSDSGLNISVDAIVMWY